MNWLALSAIGCGVFVVLLRVLDVMQLRWEIRHWKDEQ